MKKILITLLRKVFYLTCTQVQPLTQMVKKHLSKNNPKRKLKTVLKSLNRATFAFNQEFGYFNFSSQSQKFIDTLPNSCKSWEQIML